MRKKREKSEAKEVKRENDSKERVTRGKANEEKKNLTIRRI